MIRTPGIEIPCSRILTWTAAPILAAILGGCTPASTSDKACPRGNLSITALKDQDHVSRYTQGIDGPMATLFRETGPRACAVVVVADNRISTINHYGLPFETNTDLVVDDVPAVAQTRLYVGSISKTVTALAMLKLTEENAPDGGITTGPGVSLLDRPLVDLYPPVADVPEWAGFTPRQLLSHSAGVPFWPDVDDDALNSLPASAGPNAGIHPRWAFAVYRDTTPRLDGFAAGYDARYSNVGYILTGAALDWQTVTSPASAEVGYEKYVFEKIALDDNKVTEPTMVSMCLGTPWRAPEMDNLAIGYATDGTTALDPPGFSGWEGPTGGWTMTIGDLGRLMIAINTDKRVNTASFNAMTANYATGPLLGDTNWGLGVWRILDPSTGMTYGKGGDTTGFTSDFMMYRNQGVGAGIVCNQEKVDHLALRRALRSLLNACVGSGTKPAYCSPP